MRTFDILDEHGRLVAFEIDSTAVLGRRWTCRIVQSIPGTTLTRTPKAFSWFREEVFCEFLIEGEPFEIEEPWGDNSRYWIGPRPPRVIPQTEIVRDAFTRA